MKRASQGGVTLIELMVTVAIVTILAGIAYPSYQDQVRRSRRAAATAWLMNVAARQQQRFVDVRSYAAAYADLGLATPPDVAARYTITISPPASGAPPGFTAVATPSGQQLKDSCGVLRIDQAGRKTANNQERAQCW